MDYTDLSKCIAEHFDVCAPPELKPFENELHWEALEETSCFWGKRWDEISLEMFEENWFALTYFPSSALPYFLGCIMKKCIDTNQFESDALEQFFSPPTNPQKLTKFEKLEFRDLAISMSSKQLKLVVEFVNVWDAHVDNGDPPRGKLFLEALLGARKS